MRIGIVDMYFETLGGAEKYILTIASCLSSEHSVSVLSTVPNLLEKARERFRFGLENVKQEHIDLRVLTLVQKYQITRNFDVLFYISDGSIPFLFAKRNILILQFPVTWVQGKTLINRIKFRRIQSVLCYTQFVKQSIDTTFGINSVVLYPPVDPIHAQENKKRKHYSQCREIYERA